METVVFIFAAVMVLGGALGVILRPNPVHAALSLVLTLFGVAVLFVAQEAHFLAAVQIIVYSGAIVVLFLFVIMLLGVDRAEDIGTEPLAGQRPAAVVAGVAVLGMLLAALFLSGDDLIAGVRSQGGALNTGESNVLILARSLFSQYVFAFELTSALLVIAVVGAVILARRPPRSLAEGDDDKEKAQR
jgi:NADH-quinone oxidoreductase subunit J